MNQKSNVGGDGMYAPMEDLLKLLKIPELSERKKAIEALESWNEQLEMEDTIAVLVEAGRIERISDEEWDDPSLALVKAACIFIHEDMIPTLEKNMFKYSYQTINFVLSLLIIWHSEEAKRVYKKVFGQLYYLGRFYPSHEERKLIFQEKESFLMAIEVLIENEITLHPYYEEYDHLLVMMGLKHKHITISEVPLDKEFIVERLQTFIDQYMEYDQEYTREYVYEAWKSSYHELRMYLMIYLTVYGAFCSEEEILSLQPILKWKDNALKLYYVETLWKRNLHSENCDQTVQDVLVSNDESHTAFEMLKTYKPELLPTDPSYQAFYLKEKADFLFYNSLGIEKFPTEVEIMGSFQVKDVIYENDLTYYVIRFKSTDPSMVEKGWMRMLLGAYYTVSIPTPLQPSTMDDEFTDFLPWNSKTYEEHVNNFRDYLMKKHDLDNNDEIFYQSRPKFNRRNNTIAILIFVAFFGLIWVNDWFLIALVFPPIWLLLKYLHSKMLNRNILIQIRSYHMDYFYFDDCTYIPLNHISKITYEKRTIENRGRFLFLPLKTWHYVLYDYEEQEIYAIPAKYLWEELFIPILKSRTEHLAQKPVIAYEIDGGK